MRVRLRAVKDQDRVAHVILNQVEGSLGHHHVRGGDPVLDRHDGTVGTVVHEGVRVEGCDALIVQ